MMRLSNKRCWIKFRCRFELFMTPTVVQHVVPKRHPSLTWTQHVGSMRLDYARETDVCSDEGLTLEASAKHDIPQATNITYQPLLIKPIFSVLAYAEKQFFQNQSSSVYARESCVVLDQVSFRIADSNFSSKNHPSGWANLPSNIVLASTC